MTTVNRIVYANHKFYDVPVGTKPSMCGRCGLTVFWIHEHGKRIQIDCTVIGGLVPHKQCGSGISHFPACPPRAKR